jgi:hypothetical protein
MNTGTLENRLKRVEEKIRPESKRYIEFIWDGDETEEEARKRFRVEHPEVTEEDLVIWIAKWGDGPAELPLYGGEPKKEKSLSPDEEIMQIMNELGKEGYSVDDIARMMEEPESAVALQPGESEIPFSINSDLNNSAPSLEPSPMRSDELVSMFRGRR